MDCAKNVRAIIPFMKFRMIRVRSENSLSFINWRKNFLIYWTISFLFIKIFTNMYNKVCTDLAFFSQIHGWFFRCLSLVLKVVKPDFFLLVRYKWYLILYKPHHLSFYNLSNNLLYYRNTIKVIIRILTSYGKYFQELDTNVFEGIIFCLQYPFDIVLTL